MLIHKLVALPVLTLCSAPLHLLEVVVAVEIKQMALMVALVVEVEPMGREPQQVEMETPHQ